MESTRFLIHSAMRPLPGRPPVRMVARKDMASEPLGIANGFDVGVLVDVNAGADGDALGQVVAAARNAEADERFRVGANVPAELVADGRKRALFLELKE